MAESVKTPTSIATKWALIGLAVGIVITYAFQFLNIDMNSPAKYFNYVPFIAFLVLAQKELKDGQGGFLTYGQGFSVGFRYAVFSGLLTALFTLVYFKFLSPGMWDKVLEQSQTEMESKGTMSDDQIEAAMGFMHKSGIWIAIFFAAIGSALLGTVISLVTAAILKKERSPFDNDNVVVVENDPVV